MSKGYRPYLPDQDLLLPPSLQEWLPEGHLVYFVSDVVNQLDLSAVHAVYGEEKRGQPPYDPRLMIKLLLYGYCTGVFSSRRIQKRLQEDIPFRVLAAGNDPDFRTISDFRKIAGFRNALVHGYDSIDDTISWGVVTTKLGILKAELDRLLAE